MKSGKLPSKSTIWLVIIITLMSIAATGWFFHKNVNLIDRKLENIRKYENDQI